MQSSMFPANLTVATVLCLDASIIFLKFSGYQIKLNFEFYNLKGRPH